MAADGGPPAGALAGAEAWIFDLDNTLYRMTAEMAAQIDGLMGSFICTLLDVDRDEAYRVQKAYFREYGLTLRGLMLHHDVDPDEYMRHLSALDLSEIRPDPGLGDAIAGLRGRKFVYTNMFSAHTEEVVSRLGLTGHFDGIFDIGTAGYVPKPAIAPYRRLCDRYRIDPGRAVMIEDIARNLEPAATLGMATVWLRRAVRRGEGAAGAGYIDYVIDDLVGWLETVPQRHETVS